MGEMVFNSRHCLLVCYMEIQKESRKKSVEGFDWAGVITFFSFRF
jgi:hypothetical protein